MKRKRVRNKKKKWKKRKKGVEVQEKEEQLMINLKWSQDNEWGKLDWNNKNEEETDEEICKIGKKKIAGVKKYRVPKIERPSAHRTLC